MFKIEPIAKSSLDKVQVVIHSVITELKGRYPLFNTCWLRCSPATVKDLINKQLSVI